MSSKVKRESATSAHIETAYLLELSVGASRVASMLYPTSRQACIEELTKNFLARHGSTHLKSFLLALAVKLDARANSEGAVAVRHYAKYGAAPEAPVGSALALATKKRTLRTASR
jgi:hypothetical protein